MNFGFIFIFPKRTFDNQLGTEVSRDSATMFIIQRIIAILNVKVLTVDEWHCT